jgi:hypothetical protein
LILGQPFAAGVQSADILEQVKIARFRRWEVFFLREGSYGVEYPGGIIWEFNN